MGDEEVQIDDVMKVCRLCLKTEDLIWIFDDRIEKPLNLKDVIQITTGVTITPEDNVSQMLCNRCRQITIGMLKFRSSSIANDVELKAKASRKLKIKVHTSVEQLLNKYPRIILPSSITKCDIAPMVTVDKNTISSWMESYKRKRKMEKRRKKLLKLVAEKLKRDEKDQMDMDLENKIPPHLIPNKEISEISQSNKLPIDIPVPKLQISQQNIASTNVLARVDEKQHISNEKSPTSSVNYKDTDNSLVTIPTPSYGENIAKRKLSADGDSSEAKKSKLRIDDNESNDSSDSLVTIKHITKSLFICNICNSILYSAKDLKKHKQKHMKCNLCKKHFRSMDETKAHSENECEIKHIMSNLPTIYLKRCDKMKDIVDRYPSAFGLSYSSQIESVILNAVSSIQSPKKVPEIIDDPLALDSIDVKPAPLSPNSYSGPQPVCEILLISDDEEDEAQKPKENYPNISVGIKDSESNKTVQSSSNPITKKSSFKVAKPTNQKKAADTETSNRTTIKPDIEIVGKNILDVNWDDNDVLLLKNILRRTRKNIKETGVQTDMPCNNDIVPSSNKDKLFELKNLRKFLNYYKIPVNISYAAQHSVKFGFDPSPLLKKDRSWSRINTKVIPPKPSSINNNNNILPKNTQCFTSPISTATVTSNVSSGVVTTNVSPSIPSLFLIPNTPFTNTSTTQSLAPPTVQNVTIANVIPSLDSTNRTTSSVVTNSYQTSFTQSISGASVPSTNYTPINRNPYYNPVKLNSTLQNSTILNFLTKPTDLSPNTQPSTSQTNMQAPKQKFIVLNNRNFTGIMPSPPNNFPTQSGSNIPSLPLNSFANLSNDPKSTPLVNQNVSSLESNNMPTVANSVPLLSNTFVINNMLSSSSTIIDLSSDNENSAPIVNNNLPTPLLNNNMSSTITSSGMPPPSNTYVPHRPVVPLTKPKINNAPVSIPAQSQIKNVTAIESTASTSTWNGNSNFVPMIRVKNVSELR